MHFSTVRTRTFVSRFADTQWKAWKPGIVRRSLLLGAAGGAGLFLVAWLSFAAFAFFQEAFNWTTASAALATAGIFGLAAAASFGAYRAHSAKMKLRREIEKELSEANVSSLPPIEGLGHAVRADAAAAIRERSDQAMAWVVEHPFRAAAVGVATGCLVGMWTRKALGTEERLAE